MVGARSVASRTIALGEIFKRVPVGTSVFQWSVAALPIISTRTSPTNCVACATDAATANAATRNKNRLTRVALCLLRLDEQGRASRKRFEPRLCAMVASFPRELARIFY